MSLPPTSLLRKSVLNGTAGAIAALCRFTALVLAARLLGPNGSGELNYGIWLGELFAIVFTFGLPAAINRYIAFGNSEQNKIVEQRMVSWFARRHLVYTAVGTLCVGGFAYWEVLLAKGAGNNWVTPIFVMSSLANGAVQIYSGRQDYGALIRFSLFTGFTQLILIPLGAHSAGSLGASIGYALSMVLPVGRFLVIVLKTRASEIDKDIRREIARYGMLQWVALLATAVVWSRLEIVFIKEQFSGVEVGYYTAGLNLVSLATQFPVLLGGALMGHVADLAGRGDLHGVRLSYHNAFRTLSAVLVPACFGLAAIAKDLMPLLYGKEFAGASTPAMILAVGGVSMIGCSTAAVIYALGRPEFFACSGWLAGIVASLLFFYTVPTFGMTGAAGSRNIVQFAVVVASIIFLATRLGTHTPLRTLAKSLGCSIVMALLVFYLTRFLGGAFGVAAGITSGILFIIISYQLVGVFAEIGMHDAARRIRTTWS